MTNPSSVRKTGSVTRLAGASATDRSPLRQPAKIIVVDQAGIYRTEPADSEITIRQLLTHTSGQAYNFANPTMQAMLDISGEPNVINLPLVAHSGTAWNYSGSTESSGDASRLTALFGRTA